MKVILWFQSPQLPLIDAAICIVGQIYGKLDFVGLYSSLDMNLGKGMTLDNRPVPFLDEKEIAAIDCDIIIVGGVDVKMSEVLKEAARLGLDEDKVVLDRTVCVPGFTLENYRQLRHSNLSILSRYCWGGLIYNLFGLPMLSPTVNLYFDDDDFIRFLSAPKQYLELKPKFFKTGWDPRLKREYPIMQLGDIKIHMNHSTPNKLDRACEKWNERLGRINWSNLLACTCTEKPENLIEFDRLPIAKKACFVPFETTLASGYRIPSKFVHGRELWEPLNEIAVNKIQCFNLWDLLLCGKKTPLRF